MPLHVCCHSCVTAAAACVLPLRGCNYLVRAVAACAVAA
nr:hypothetical protein [Kibdelosporangium sp. MJ126-NF4]CTQ96817.1 hypothetical protein [Kibdelosporangium sp. MJ126-NF4]